MSDNELLLALSEMIDKKLDAQLEPIKKDIYGVKKDINSMKKDSYEMKKDINSMKKDSYEMRNDINSMKKDSYEMKKDINSMKNDINNMKKDSYEMRNDINSMKKDSYDMRNDIYDVKNEVQKINIILENEIRSDIKLLAENYLPAAIRYEKANKEHEEMKSDIEILKKVVTEHSEKIQKIS
jgi:chromosome segregation ATPase